jgi:hypothetical protein
MPSNKRCEHGKRQYFCRQCGGRGVCSHGKQKNRCKDCGGASICEHGRLRGICKQCKGASICEHDRERSFCKECNGNQVCQHSRHRTQCKQCGTHRGFRRGGFTLEEIRTIGAVDRCQFPGCKIERSFRPLHSDHVHDGKPINRDNYRGEICRGHNWLLADLDKHPEWADPLILSYMNQRPYRDHLRDANV